jgi:DNA-binding response OmpR family regulator
MSKIVIIEDDVNIARLLKLYLENGSYAVEMATDGTAGLELVRSVTPDLVLLDLMLPGMNGYAICKTLRQESSVPIIMITARGETIDKVQGLQLGADDYITKPFDMQEVMARIHAVLRRSQGKDKPRRIEYDRFVVDMDSFTLTLNGVVVDTPPKELELLYFLAGSPNRVFTRNQLLDEVWGFDYFGDGRTVDVHVKRLREKVEGISEQWSLKTVWGIGYKFEVASLSSESES